MKQLGRKKVNIKRRKVIVALSFVLLMTLGLSPRAEDLDYGDDCTLAEPIDPNGTVVEGILSDTSDQDWFSFTAVADGFYEMTLLSQSGWKYMNVYGPDGCPESLQSITSLTAETGTTTQEVFIQTAGTYYILVYADSGLYRVSVNLLDTCPSDTHPDTCDNPAILIVDDPPVNDCITDFGMDEDWFTFATTVLHKYQVTLYRAMMNTDVVYDLYRSDCGVALSSGQTDSLTFVSLDGANYDLRVKSNSFNKEGYYELWVDDLGAVPDDYNNTCEGATPITTDGVKVEGRLQYQATLFTDEDWFSFTAVPDGFYEMTLLSQSGWKYMSVYGPDGCPGSLQAITSLTVDTATTTQEVFIHTAGTYYIAVHSGSGLYRVSVNLLDTCPSDTGPDTCDNPAILIVDDPPVNDCITDFGIDEDWFTFATSVLHKYQVNFYRPVNTDVIYGLHETDCGEQLYSTATSMTVIPFSDCNYDLRVRSNSFSQAGYYEIWVEDLGGVPDDHGNTYDTATPIPTTGVHTTGHTGQYSATIGPADDDWFSFTAAPGLYEIALYADGCGFMGSGPSTTLYLYALDEAHELQQITYFSAKGSTVTQSVSIDTAGTYYMGVHDGCGYYWVSVLAAEPQCGDPSHPYPTGDSNQDCVVNLVDFAMFATHWLEDNRP